MKSIYLCATSFYFNKLPLLDTSHSLSFENPHFMILSYNSYFVSVKPIRIENRGKTGAQGSRHCGVWGGPDVRSFTPASGEAVSAFRNHEPRSKWSNLIVSQMMPRPESQLKPMLPIRNESWNSWYNSFEFYKLYPVNITRLSWTWDPFLFKLAILFY